MAASVAEAAAQLRADLQLLDANAKEAVQLLDLAAWQLGELDRQARPMASETLPLVRARDNIQAARRSTEDVLEHLDASRKMQPIIQAGPRGGSLEAFLAAMERLEAAIDFLEAHRALQSADDALRHTTALRDAGLAAAGAEFGALMQKHAAAVPQSLIARVKAGERVAGAGAAPGSTGSDAPLHLLPAPALERLHALAAAMLHGGGTPPGRACIRTYAEARRVVLQAALDAVLLPFAASGGTSGSSKEEARLAWQQLEGRVPGWVAALRLYVRLAQEEARLCAAVFPPSEQAAVLAQVAASGASSLMDSADVVLAARRAPEKMFGLLDMHDAAAAALAPLRATLAGGPARPDRVSSGGAEPLAVVAQLSQLRARLAAEVRACFAGLQESVGREAARGVPADGTVHPLCAGTLAALKRLLACESALPVLFADAIHPKGRGGGGLAEEARLLDLMGKAVARLLDLMLSALDAKARATYKQRALACLHQLNNVQHVQHALGASRELQAVGEGWLEQHKGWVEELQASYVEAGWGPLLSLLRADARQPLPPNLGSDRAARQAVKDKWAAVNRALGEAAAQAGWAAPDAGLRFALKDSLTEALAPLYAAFTAKYRAAPYTENHRKHEQYSPADLQTLLADLFERSDAAGVGRSPPSAGALSRRLSRRRSSNQATP